ncbi:unnamed protein product [Gordionus sp. m RMFG-2023]|uniref:venom protein 302-like n=1 Tax=Gordionus sp. m RMFG-2023 TaxID=3053472 RepID=UPI0030E43C52
MFFCKSLIYSGIFLGFFNIIGVETFSCPCQRNPTECPAIPPCKGDVIKDACGCCPACAKVKGEVCGGPSFTSGRCSKGLICQFKSYQEPIQSDGVCVAGFPRKINDPCGDAWQQGSCRYGLMCKQISPGNIGKCVSLKFAKKRV